MRGRLCNSSGRTTRLFSGASFLGLFEKKKPERFFHYPSFFPQHYYRAWKKRSCSVSPVLLASNESDYARSCSFSLSKSLANDAKFLGDISSANCTFYPGKLIDLHCDWPLLFVSQRASLLFRQKESHVASPAGKRARAKFHFDRWYTSQMPHTYTSVMTQ